MEKIRVYNSRHTQVKESFYEILKEISEIEPQTTFTKEEEEEFLKDAIVIFEYLKSGIDVKSSEILINNGEIPFSCLEKILIKFSENQRKDDNKALAFNIYINDKGNPVKIYEFQNCDKKELAGNSHKFLGRKPLSMRRNILFVNSASSTERKYITKSQLKKIIDYAFKNDVMILYDATSNKESNGIETIKSIYEIENAKKVAIEFKRLSSVENDKITCGYLVVPDCLRTQRKVCKENIFYKIKDLLQEEIKREKLSRKSLKKSFLNYACL